MCSTLYFENQDTTIGSRIFCIVPTLDKTKESIWSGFCQIEKLDWWKKISNGVEVEVNVSAFQEGKYNFPVPGGKILGLYLCKDVEVNGKVIGKAGSCKLITRSAQSDFEKKVHSRFPVTKIPHIFQEADIFISGKINQLSFGDI